MRPLDFGLETMNPTLMRYAAPNFGLSEAALLIEIILHFYLVPQIDSENRQPSSASSEQLLIRWRNLREVGQNGRTCHWQ